MGLLDTLFPSTEPDPSLGTSPADMQTLALGKALQQIQETGRMRTAGPMGSIAQNLMPLMGAMVQAKAAQAQAVQQAQANALDRANAMVQLQQGIKDLNASDAGPPAPKNFAQAVLQRIANGQPFDDLIKANQGLQKPAADNEISLVRKANAGDPEAKATLAGLATQKQAEAGGLAEARMGPALALHKAEKEFDTSMLKPPTEKQISAWTSGISSLSTLDKAITGLASNTPLQVAGASIAGGLYSTDASRDYQAFKNDWDNFRYGARGQSRAALDRINQEIPPLSMSIWNPQGFLDGLRHVKQKVKEQVALDIEANRNTVKVPPEITDALGAMDLTDTTSLKSNGGQPVEVDPSLAGQLKNNLQQMMKAGYTREEAKAMLYKRMGIAPDGTPGADGR